jgi:hypothetical protein
MDRLRNAASFNLTGSAPAGIAPARTDLHSVISEMRIHGAFGSYHICWDGEIHDPDLPPPEISDGPYVTFSGALRAARRRIRKERRKLHQEIINAGWKRAS